MILGRIMVFHECHALDKMRANTCQQMTEFYCFAELHELL